MLNAERSSLPPEVKYTTVVKYKAQVRLIFLYFYIYIFIKDVYCIANKLLLGLLQCLLFVSLEVLFFGGRVLLSRKRLLFDSSAEKSCLFSWNMKCNYLGSLDSIWNFPNYVVNNEWFLWAPVIDSWVLRLAFSSYWFDEKQLIILIQKWSKQAEGTLLKR